MKLFNFNSGLSAQLINFAAQQVELTYWLPVSKLPACKPIKDALTQKQDSLAAVKRYGYLFRVQISM